MKILKMMTVAVMLMAQAAFGATMDVIWQTPQQQTNRLWYSLNNGQWAVDDFFILNNNQWIQQNQVPVFNFRDILMQHLQNQGANCLRELMRLILAQNSHLENNHPDNNLTNNSHAYIYTPTVQDRIPAAFNMLKNHMLQHGHLGYFPVFTANIQDANINRFVKRGIFNIQLNIMNTINNMQWYVLGHYIHCGPNFYNGFVPNGFNVDPAAGQGNATLLGATNRLLTALFSRNNAINVTNIAADLLDPNRFTIDFNWNGGAITGATEPNQEIGITSTGFLTNRIRIVVDVAGDVIRIISIYPQG